MQPLDPQGMANFSGGTTVGDWTMTILDVAGGDDGTLNEWGLNVYDAIPTPPCSCVAAPPPPNDPCIDAIEIFDGDTPFAPEDSTQDGVGGCARAEDGDVWYRYTATCDGTVYVGTCGQATYNTGLMAYPGAGRPPSSRQRQ